MENVTIPNTIEELVKALEAKNMPYIIEPYFLEWDFVIDDKGSSKRVAINSDFYDTIGIKDGKKDIYYWWKYCKETGVLFFMHRYNCNTGKKISTWSTGFKFRARLVGQ